MRKSISSLPRVAAILLITATTCFAQAQHQSRVLIVNGSSGEVPVISDNGHSYVDVTALATIANGSLSFSGNKILLTIPPGTGGSAPPSADASAPPPDPTALSRPFMKAAVEEIALIREWAAPMAYNIQQGYPIQEDWVASNRQRAADGLRMASVAASTAGDHSAVDLLTNEFNGVGEWSDRLLQAAKSMDTAKYTMSPGTLRNEPLSQKLITCWHFLGSMLVSGTYQDDSSCH